MFTAPAFCREPIASPGAPTTNSAYPSPSKSNGSAAPGELAPAPPGTSDTTSAATTTPANPPKPIRPPAALDPDDAPIADTPFEVHFHGRRGGEPGEVANVLLGHRWRGGCAPLVQRAQFLLRTRSESSALVAEKAVSSSRAINAAPCRSGRSHPPRTRTRHAGHASSRPRVGCGRVAGAESDVCPYLSVVVPACGDAHFVPGDLVHQAVLIGDASRPVPGEIVLERLRLADTRRCRCAGCQPRGR